MLVPDAYENGLLEGAPQVMSLGGRPYFKRWRCPLCNNHGVSMPVQTGADDQLKAMVSAHLSECSALS